MFLAHLLSSCPLPLDLLKRFYHGFRESRGDRGRGVNFSCMLLFRCLHFHMHPNLCTLISFLLLCSIDPPSDRNLCPLMPNFLKTSRYPPTILCAPQNVTSSLSPAPQLVERAGRDVEMPIK
jgi:hypothetical protein